MAKQIERKFLTELKKAFESYGGFWHKISDTPVSWLGGAMRFEPTKPFDSIAVYLGIPIAIEAKIVTGFKSFGIKTLRPSQVEGLTKFSLAGGRSFVFLNVRIAGNKSLGIKRENRLLIFDWDDLARMSRNFKKKEIEEFPYIAGRKGTFEIDDWLRGLSENKL